MARTRLAIRAALLAALALAAPGSVAAQAGPASARSGAAAGAALPGFSAEAGIYTAIAEALGDSASEAQEKARGAALGLLLRGLGKDRLFAEIFVGAPPVGLGFTLVSSKAEGGRVRARVSLRVDDESVRIIERGPYLAAALRLLDEAEKDAIEAEERAAWGADAEAAAGLGEALVSYGMAVDASRSGLLLLDGLEDASIFSSSGKRTAPDLRRALAATGGLASAGIERVRVAQASLEADETGRAIGESVRRALAAAEHADALLAESGDILSDPSAAGPERLSPLRDRLEVERRSIGDASAELGRAGEALPRDRGFRTDELEFARHRLATVDAALLKAHRSVDREIRDPAVRRAARARAIRWAFLHSPSERLSLRAYLPFRLQSAESSLFGAAPFDFALGAEGAFAFGDRGGIWVRSRVASSTTELSAEPGEGEEYSIRQSFDLGFWRDSLFFAGFAWDWYRGCGGERLARPGRIELGLGGVSKRGRGREIAKADWLLALSYELPYETEEFNAWNLFNLGLEAQFRLGDIALLEASGDMCPHRGTDGESLSEVLRYAFGFGLRLPPPFLAGAEYCGSLVWPIDEGKLGERSSAGAKGAFRFFLGYSL